jgi:pimeloyl-ACP methyl ester carboxylesterase
MPSIRTAVLEIFYEDTGPRDGPPVLMLHGVAVKLNDKGWRTIIPYLRGSHPNRFLSSDTARFASGVALAQDAIDLAAALNFDRLTQTSRSRACDNAYSHDSRSVRLLRYFERV